MTSLSQKNLMKLAKQSDAKGDTKTAIQNLEEALRDSQPTEIVIELCDLYLKSKQEDQAYTLIKEEPDLFSDERIFAEYSKILQANHFLIEALELEHLRGEKLSVKVKPADLKTQQEIMRAFKTKKQVSQADYEQLLKLDLVNFKTFAQSMLLDPSQNFAVRLSLCEDLVRLGVKDKIKVWIIGNQEEFVPAATSLLEKETIYQEIVSSMGSKYHNRPSQLPLVLGEVNLVLGSLYPKLSKYVDEPDSFASDLSSYLENHDDRGHQKLFKAIYANLPQ